MKFALLTTVDAPLLGYLIEELLKLNLTPELLVFDSKNFSEKDMKIHEERTEGKMPVIPLSTFAAEKISEHFVENHNDKNCLNLVFSENVDLIVNAGTPRILRGEILDATEHGIINCHPGLLPYFKGCSCVEWAIYYDKQIGNSVHKVCDGIDNGPLIRKEGLMFSKNDSYSDIRVKVFKSGNELLARTIKDIAENKITSLDYIEQSKGEYYKPIEKSKFELVKNKVSANEYKYQI
jgi:folate-dependent phosphoribosylglycinamide formyltransferase PurN